MRLSGSELLLYGGLAIMGMAVILAMICILLFRLTGRKLKEKLEQEYGELPYLNGGKTKENGKCPGK